MRIARYAGKRVSFFKKSDRIKKHLKQAGKVHDQNRTPSVLQNNESQNQKNLSSRFSSAHIPEGQNQKFSDRMSGPSSCTDWYSWNKRLTQNDIRDIPILIPAGTYSPFLLMISRDANRYSWAYPAYAPKCSRAYAPALA